MALCMLVTVLQTSGCKISNTTKNNKSMDCRDILDRFARAEFMNWEGLSPSCSPSTIANYVSGNLENKGIYALGTKLIPVSFVNLAFKHYKQPIRLWFRGEKTEVLEVMYPEITDLKGLLENLGPPSAKMDYYFDVMVNEGGAYVNVTKGITLFMNTARDRVMKIWVYVPVTLERYVGEMHDFTAPREEQLREE